MKIQTKTPAKINLTLEIVKRREDGFHEISSIMQAVDLYDILTVTVEDNQEETNSIELSGNSQQIPYDSSNLVYKSAELFLDKTGITNKKLSIFIEKRIPVAAGLAGGSSNAAGTLLALNRLFGDLLDKEALDDLASKLGSDVNFCMWGGTRIATSRGEVLNKISTPDFNAVIAKPSKLSISAKEAYTKYAELEHKPAFRNPEPMIKAIEENNVSKIAELLHNVLECAVLPNHTEIFIIMQQLKASGCLNAIMSGSGPSVFGIYKNTPDVHLEDSEVFFVKTVNNGVILE